MDRTEFRFLERLRVRWGEVDAQGIVFFPHYLMYFNTASVGYWRAVGLPFPDAFRALDGDLYLKKATLEYQGSARYEDELDIGLRCVRIGTSSLTVACAVFRAHELLVQGEVVSVFANPTTQRSKQLPREVRAALETFEHGTGSSGVSASTTMLP